MPAIDLQQILNDSIEAVKPILGKSWKSFKPYAEHEFKKFAESAAFLAELRLTNKIDDDELKERLEIQRIALKNVMLAVEGIGLVTAQNAINAVIEIVKKAAKAALSVALPI